MTGPIGRMEGIRNLPDFVHRTTRKENLCDFRRSRDSNRKCSRLYTLQVQGDVEIVVE